MRQVIRRYASKVLAITGCLFVLAGADAGRAATPASGDFIHYPTFETGNGLWRDCGSRTEGDPPGYCLGSVAGIADAESYEAANNKTPPRYCHPNDATLGQITDVVRLYLEKHPEERDASAASLVVYALREAFPCPAR